LIYRSSNCAKPTPRLLPCSPESHSALIEWLERRARHLCSYTFPHAAPRPVEFLRPAVLWRSHRLASELRALDLTIVTPRRARTLYRLARAVERDQVPGAIVDCGVRNGGSSLLLSAGAPSREIWAFDSFEGMPASTGEDAAGPLYPQGALRGSVQILRRGFERYGNGDRLHVVAGWFEDTLAGAAADIGAIAILHVDCDYYEPVKLVLGTLYPNLSPGGYAVIDDYFSFPGARQATDEIRTSFAVTQPFVWDHYWRRVA
jgi:O-methyltransferase